MGFLEVLFADNFFEAVMQRACGDITFNVCLVCGLLRVLGFILGLSFSGVIILRTFWWAGKPRWGDELTAAKKRQWLTYYVFM